MTKKTPKNISLWLVENRKAKDLLPYEHNPRTISKAKMDQLKQRIESQGFRVPPSIDTDGTILAGHQRIKALISMGLGDMEIPVSVPQRKLTEQERKEVVATDNLSWGDWDMDLLTENWNVDELVEWGFDEDMFGEPAEERADDMPEDELPLSVEAVTEAGDFYTIGQHALLCGDSTQEASVKHLMGDKLVDLLLTDPPYNVALGMNETPKEAKKRNRRTDGLTVKNDEMSDDQFRTFLSDCFKACDSVMRPGASFYIWHADSEGFNFRGACRDAGWQVRQCLIWAKQTMVMGRQDYHWKHEPCLYGWKDGAAHTWNTDRKQTTILEFDRPSRNAEHPTMKPVDLMGYQIQNNTKEGNIVLDVFGGSGSTMVAAHHAGRICHSMELDPVYCDVIVARMHSLFPELEITRNGKPFTPKVKVSNTQTKTKA